MKLPLTALFLAEGILSIGLRDRIQARSALQRQTQPLALVEPDSTSRVAADGITYSSNWVGMVHENPPPKGSYQSVSATFTVPKPVTGQSSDSGAIQAASAWVGIDGDTYTTAILQAGIDFYWDNGRVYNSAWYEWFPDVAHDLDLAVNTGDVITVTVEASSETKGKAEIVNESTGQRVTQQIAAPNGDAKLAGQNADWIVEDFQSGGKMVPLVNFGTVEFSKMQTRAGGMQTLGTKGATVIELQQNGKVMAEVEVVGEDGMTVTYVG